MRLSRTGLWLQMKKNPIKKLIQCVRERRGGERLRGAAGGRRERVEEGRAFKSFLVAKVVLQRQRRSRCPATGGRQCFEEPEKEAETEFFLKGRFGANFESLFQTNDAAAVDRYPTKKV